MEERKLIDYCYLADRIVEEEMKFLQVFYRGLPKCPVVVLPETKKATLELNGEMRDGFTKGQYCHKGYINIFVGSLLEFSGDDEDKFRHQVMQTLAHEFFHHYQFTGDRRKHYIQSVKEDKANNVPYWNTWIEVQAREAADWYIDRRKPLVLRMA